MDDDRDFRSPYPDYDVLDKWDSPSWNDTTRRVVADRLENVPRRRFFTEQEWRTLEAVCDRIVPQPDRPRDPVPIVPWIDEKLLQHQGEGFRYADMPPMEEAWRKGLHCLDSESERRYGAPFTDLSGDEQDDILKRVQTSKVRSTRWRGLPPHRFFSDLLAEVVSIYYSHPKAWSEIGFGGPASPRGYVRIGPDTSDPWEAKERPAGGPR